ncbi:MAG: hypothetical protein N2561_10050 [Bacteroidetes bacterium]|nr:hypothetical protein [Rhodothermia bacterium]MCS7155274.1 hypothetical protein [Bacteroidota bacterium]MCX7907859.1 hypothetical protein [Bacteroidota bacterium]MDW8138678.1 hypothetical protein [Bacteroidota bacterium]MDW8284736.1 hypothetical protein [Bacteroidota bacterium]
MLSWWTLGALGVLAALLLHVLLGWSAALLVPLLLGLFMGRGAWWRAGVVLLAVWALLLVYNEAFDPEAMARLRMSLSGFVGNRVPPWGFPALSLGVAFGLGALAGWAGTALYEVLTRPRLP